MVEKDKLLDGQFQKIKCDCCGHETLAEIRGDKIVIIDKRHGKKHVAVITLVDILSKMKKLAKDTICLENTEEHSRTK
jgi:hypothetical protein